MECQFVRFRYGPAVQTVGLYPGLPADELSAILKTVLPVAGNIVAFQGEKGAVVPLTMACRNPGVLSGSIFVILTAQNTSDGAGQSIAPEFNIPSAPPLTSEVATEITQPSMGSDPRLAAPAPPLRPSADPVYDDELSAEDAQLADSTLDELLRFIAGLRVKRVIKKAEADALEELLFNNSSLVFAAYSVAKSAGDSQYLAEVCKDIAQSMMTSAGLSACAAQDDVLQCCDHLYINSKITENQLLYLRHLVLIRDEDVAQLYDDYQEHMSQDKLLRDLFRLANTHPRLSLEGNDQDEAVENAGDEDDNDSEDDEDAEDDTSAQWAALQKEQQRRRQQEDELLLAAEAPATTNPYSRQASQERAAAKKHAEQGTRRSAGARTSTLNGLLSMMLRTGDVTPVEAMLLNHMIASDHEIILAAYDLYESDGDLTELQDTMMRLAKLEMHRRNEEVERQQRAINAAEGRDEARQTLLRKYGDKADADDNGDGDEDGDDYREYGEEEGVEGEGENGELSSEGDAVLTQMLSAMGVDNNWQETVPPRFVLTVFAAAQRKLLTVGQARALCDLFQAQYDLVRAAWEVFNVQGDVVDFTDTLRRIVRDLNFREDGDVRVSGETAKNAQEAHNARVMQTMKEGQDRAAAVQSSRDEALAAVAAAKRELLKHSLEIMVKQGLVSTAAATGLYERALRGDPLTDAAIDSYAADRDIMEFLDTLQILANNSPEELDKVMQAALEAEDDEVVEGERGMSERDNSSPSVPEDEEDEVEEEESGDMDQAQRELRAFVQKLSRGNVIDKTIYSVLLKLIVSRDDRILAAHDVYRDFGDEEDLVDSLLRIARKEKAGLSRQATEDGGIEMSDISLKPTNRRSKGQNLEGVEVEMTRFRRGSADDEGDEDDDVEMADLDGGRDNDEEDDDEPAGLLNSADQKSILEILAKADAIDVETCLKLAELIDDDDEEVGRVFLQYERNKDVYHLIENLKRYAERAVDDDDEEEEQDEDDEKGNEGSGELDEDERDAIETRFLNIIQNMNLSHLETAALRLAIARHDSAVRTTLEDFRANRDTEALKRSLREVARTTISETLSEAGYDGVEGDEEEGGNDGDVDAQDSNDERDDEEEEGEEEDDEDGGQPEGGLMSTQSAREYIFPILIGELVKENVMSSSEGEILKSLFLKGDAVVSAALDVYDLDSDMAELVDTLQRVVATAADQ